MKQLLSSYSVAGNVVTLTGVNRPQESILSITDASTGTILYTAQTGGATAYSQGTNSTITLSTTPVSSDRLQIYYDDGVASTNAPTSVSVSNFPATQPVSGSVSVSNFPTSTEISNDAGNPIPVSGTVTANTGLTQPLTDTQLRATPVPVSVSSTVGVATTGSGNTPSTAFYPGYSSNGNFTGVTNYSPLPVQFSNGSGTLINSLPTGTNSIGQVTANAGTNLNTSALALESGGNLATIATNTGKIPSLVSGRVPVDGSGVTQPVSGTFWQATQPVSLSSVPAHVTTPPTGSLTCTASTVGTSSAVSLSTTATKSFDVQNCSSTASLYLSTNATPSATNGIIIPPLSVYTFQTLPTNQYYLLASAASTPYCLIYA